jgi:hypothetical protein
MILGMRKKVERDSALPNTIYLVIWSVELVVVLDGGGDGCSED